MTPEAMDARYQRDATDDERAEHEGAERPCPDEHAPGRSHHFTPRHDAESLAALERRVRDLGEIIDRLESW